MNTEIWKPIPGAEGYEVSNLGNVKNVNKTTYLALSSWSGYYKVRLGSRGGDYLVHRLVAQAFIPNPDNKPQVNHINGNKKDNRVENLEWVTVKENIQHAFKTGLHVYTPEVRKAMSDGLKGKPKSEETRKKYSEYAKNRTPEHRKHLCESRKGKIWVNNGVSRMLIQSEDLQEYLDKGYVLGRGHKTA